MAEPIIGMVERYQRLLEVKDALAAEVKENNAEIEAARTELAEYMLENDINKIAHCGYAFSLSPKTRFSKKAGADEELFELLRNDGLGDIIKETVNAQTLQGAISGLVCENDGELPEEYKAVINVYEFLDITRRKSTK